MRITRGFFMEADMPYSGLSERRRHQRLSMNFPVFYMSGGPLSGWDEIGEGQKEAVTIDLSEGGVSFLSKNKIPGRTALLLKLFLFKMDEQGAVSFLEPIEVSGEVRSCIVSEENEYRIGVCFKELKKEHKAYISSTLASGFAYYV